MAEINGKTARLLNRLPHFYNPEDLEKSFLNLYGVFGNNLEQCERDLFEVLRSHHVQTADNAGSKGYIAAESEKGDLDKLFSLYLESLGGTAQLVSMNPLFTTRSFEVEKLLNTLNESKEKIFKVLRPYILYADKTDTLNNYLIENILFTKDEINSTFVFSLITKDSSFFKYIADQLSKETTDLLQQYEGDGIVNPKLAETLTADLNLRILKDPFLFKNNLNYFKQITLRPDTKELCYSLNKEFLKSYHTKNFQSDPGSYDNNITNLQLIIDKLNQAEAPELPVMNQIQRFNRMLLDDASAFFDAGKIQWGFNSRNIPSVKVVRELLKERLNILLVSDTPEVEKIFLTVLNSSVDPEGIQKIYSSDKLLFHRILLESVFPYEIQHIYRAYQERLNALIKVLRKGASTKDGIRDIVAANFGLIGDSPDVLKSKELIQIIEFDPVETSYFTGGVSIQQSFSITSDNKEAVIPKLKITMLESRIKSIQNLRVYNSKTNDSFIIPVTMKTGDSLIVENDTIYFNGVLFNKKIQGNVLSLPSLKEVNWAVDAEILSNTDQLTYGFLGRFDKNSFGKDIFVDQNEPVMQVDVLTAKLTYGAFSIKIPWHIEGVTDKFAENADHPRHKIRDLVQKVKAAGVRVQVSYFQDFREQHDLSDQLNFGLHGSLLNEIHESEDKLSLESRLGMAESHDIDDRLRTSGTFDYTAFESGNTFE